MIEAEKRDDPFLPIVKVITETPLTQNRLRTSKQTELTCI